MVEQTSRIRREFLVSLAIGLVVTVVGFLLDKYGERSMEMIASLWPVWAGAAVFLLAWLIQTLIALRRSVDRIFADTVYEETEPVGANPWRFSRLESMNESERQTKFAQNPQMGDWYRLEVWWRQRTRTL